MLKIIKLLEILNYHKIKDKMSKCTHNILFLIFTLNLARFGDCLRISSGWAWDHKTCDGIGNHLVKVNRVKVILVFLAVGYFVSLLMTT